MSEIDPHSPSWRAVAIWAEERLEQNRRMLESPGLPPLESDHLRGAIRELKLLLDLAQPTRISQAAIE